MEIFKWNVGDKMFFPPFWILSAACLLLLSVVLFFKRPTFIDLQIYIAITALVMSCDMLFCKQFALYHYVDIQFRGWYSFWANIIIVPSIGLVFIKFLPVRPGYAAVYIASWTIAGSIFEEYIVKPLGIVIYVKWKVIPWSTVGTAIILTALYFYCLFLKNRIPNSDYMGKASP